jgi:hypothetical protein
MMQQWKSEEGGRNVVANSPFRWTAPSLGNENFHPAQNRRFNNGNGNANCVNVIKGCQVKRAGSLTQFLREFCHKNNLPEPMFKTISIGIGADQRYNCKVTV